MGKNRTIKKIQPSGQAVLKNSPDKGAAIGLEMAFCQDDLGFGGEEPHGMKACCMDDLFRCIGTKVSHDFPARFLYF